MNSGFKDAPPTKNPSTSGFAANSQQFFAFTEPIKKQSNQPITAQQIFYIETNFNITSINNSNRRCNLRWHILFQESSDHLMNFLSLFWCGSFTSANSPYRLISYNNFWPICYIFWLIKGIELWNWACSSIIIKKAWQHILLYTRNDFDLSTDNIICSSIFPLT